MKRHILTPPWAVILACILLVIAGHSMHPTATASASLYAPGTTSSPRLASAAAASQCSQWNLVADWRLYPGQENPNRDSCGNLDVWYFMGSQTLGRDPQTYYLLPLYYHDTAGIEGFQAWMGTATQEGYHASTPGIGLNATGVTIHSSPSVTIPPDTINVHPAPSQMLVVGWRSPVAGNIAIAGSVSSNDGNGGDGILWFIDKGSTNLASGSYGNGGAQNFRDGVGGGNLANVAVSQGDFIYFIVHPNQNYYYDSTALGISIEWLAPLQPTERVAPFDFVTELSGLVNCNSQVTLGTGEAKVDSQADTGKLLLDLRAKSFTGNAPGKAGVGIRYTAPASGRITISADVDVAGIDYISLLSLPDIYHIPIDVGLVTVKSSVEISVVRINPRRDDQHETGFASRKKMWDPLNPLPGIPIDIVKYQPPKTFTDTLDVDVVGGDQLYICAGVKSTVTAQGTLPLLAVAQALYGSGRSGGTKVDRIVITYDANLSATRPSTQAVSHAVYLPMMRH